jgi:hypothetical protein
MLDHIDAGWRIGEFSSTGGTFFCTSGVERRMVSITPTDPGQRPCYGASHLTQSPGHDEKIGGYLFRLYAAIQIPAINGWIGPPAGRYSWP